MTLRDPVRVLEAAAVHGAATKAGSSGAALGRLGEWARGGRLWVALAGVLAATGRRGRAAAFEGLASVAATEALGFAAKRLVRRRRPAGFGRGRGTPPTTSSFPSTHAAAAAAFATGAAGRLPAAGVVLAPLAAAVAGSRVTSRRHFPTDVLAGAALGVAVGIAVHVIRRRRAGVPPPA